SRALSSTGSRSAIASTPAPARFTSPGAWTWWCVARRTRRMAPAVAPAGVTLPGDGVHRYEPDRSAPKAPRLAGAPLSLAEQHVRLVDVRRRRGHSSARPPARGSVERDRWRARGDDRRRSSAL